MHAKEGRGGGTHTQKSLFIHTQWIPRRPAEETNTGKEETCGALPLSRQGEVAASILTDPAQAHFLVLSSGSCCSTGAWNDIRR